MRDNYGTRTRDRVERWLARHRRFHLHFTPTSSSWLNGVERWFRELTEKRIRRGVFHSVPEWTAAMEEFLRVYNGNPKAFVWTASANAIVEKVRHCKAIFESLR